RWTLLANSSYLSWSCLMRNTFFMAGWSNCAASWNGTWQRRCCNDCFASFQSACATVTLVCRRFRDAYNERPPTVRHSFFLAEFSRFSMAPMSPTVYTDILKTARLLALSAAIAIAPALAGAQEETAVAPAASLTAQTPPAPVETVGALSSIPAPDVNARAWVTLDANSAQIIAEENADERVEPASLT